jgi:hypothetical protein
MNSRKIRGKVQKLYLIERKDVIDKYIMSYVVMGSTGNLYTVDITYKPQCTCPDYISRQKRCKHIFFILIRIMNVKDGNEDKEKFTKYALTKMFNYSTKRIIDKNAIATDYIKSKYQKIKNNNGDTVELKTLDDLCPVCLDDLTNGEPVIYCINSCGKPIHEDCFRMWTNIKPKNCLSCNAPWDKQKDSIYINLK